MRILRPLGIGLLWLVILCLVAVVAVPPFLDRIWYDGPASDHYDGQRFANPDGEPVPGLSGPRGGVLSRFIPGGAPRPPWPERVAVRTVDPRRLPPLKPGQMRAIWVGHATVLVQVPGLNILTDPVWSEVSGPFGLFGPRRVMAPGIPFEALPRIDLVLVSHNHYDHLDLATLKRLWTRDRPVIVSGLGNDRLLASRGMPSRALDWGQSLRLPRATVHLSRNHHWTSRWLSDRNRALWTSFVVTTAAGNLFFAGDTGPGDMRWPLEARRWAPIRLAIIPIGAFRFVPGQMVSGAHIGPREAVEVFSRLGAAAAIPIHWGTFRLSYEAWDTPPGLLRLFEDCAGIDPARFATVMPGVPVMAPTTPAPAGPPRRAASACREGSAAVRAFR